MFKLINKKILSLTCSLGSWRAWDPQAPADTWGSFTDCRDSRLPLLALLSLFPIYTKWAKEVVHWQAQKEIIKDKVKL